MAVDIRTFGCDPASSDNTAALNLALASGGKLIIPANNTFLFTGTLFATVDGTQLEGEGPTSVLLPVSSNNSALVNVKANDFSAKNFKYGNLTSASGMGFLIGPDIAVSGITIEDIQFEGNAGNLENCIYLYSCSNIDVTRCRFNQITYGVIQRQNANVKTIKITKCYGEDLYADMIGMDGENGGSSQDILVEGNTLWSTHGYPTQNTERRFVGLSNACDVDIVDNFVQDVCGDSAIHVEGTIGGRLNIARNKFIDCIPTGGNDGWIYVLTSAASMIAKENWFICTDVAAAGYALSTTSGAFNASINFSDNNILDLTGQQCLGGVDAAFLNSGCGKSRVQNNTMINGSNLVVLYSSSNISVSGNTLENCRNGVASGNIGTPDGAAGTNIDIKDNTFDVSHFAVHADMNTNGTGKPTGWTTSGNRVLSGYGILVANGVDCIGMNNRYAAGIPNYTAGNDKNDYIDGTGWVH